MEVKKFLSGLARLAVAVVLFACPQFVAGAEAAGKLRIIASLFPQYDFARRIAGDRATVRLLLPPGVESHSYEPTPSDMKEVANADLFIFTGEYMEPWAKRLASAAGKANGATVVDASRGISLIRDDAEHGHEEEGGHDHAAAGEAHAHEFNPHVWLDPTLAAIMAKNIADALVQRDPAHADFYRRNEAGLQADLAALDDGFKKTVQASPRRTLVFGERFAFAYFFLHYGLKHVGAYASDSPGSEPGLKAVIAVVNYVKENKVRYIYQEAMDQGRISQVIRQETGAEILLVDSLHNLPAVKIAAGATYLDVMRRNMAAFARGLE